MAITRKRAFYLILIFLIIIDICLLAYVTFYPVDSSLKVGAWTFDLILCIILWIEFIYSYYHCDDRKQYLRDNGLSILGMLPLNFYFLRALRLIKLVQMIKHYVLARDSEKAFTKFLKRTYLDKILFVAIIFIFLLTVLIRIVDSDIHDLATALWYIVVSATSTGYGDIVPTTVSGRIVGIIAMVGGILIFSTITAVISSIYVSRISRDTHNDLESKIEDLTLEVSKLNEKIDELKNKKE